MLQIIFEKMHKDAIMPMKATSDSACFDVYSVEDAFIRFGKVTVVDLGFRIKIPIGYEIVVRPRSGLAFKHGITIVNSPGTVDEDFRGCMKIALTSVNKYHQPDIYNKGYTKDGSLYFTEDKPFKISKGDRIAQIALKKVEEYEFVEGIVETNTERAEGGFGSTGK